MSSFIQASLVYEVVQEACPPGRRHAPLLVGVWNLSGADVWTAKKMGICRDEWEVIMMILVYIEYIQYVSVCNSVFVQMGQRRGVRVVSTRSLSANFALPKFARGVDLQEVYETGKTPLQLALAWNSQSWLKVFQAEIRLSKWDRCEEIWCFWGNQETLQTYRWMSLCTEVILVDFGRMMTHHFGYFGLLIWFLGFSQVVSRLLGLRHPLVGLALLSWRGHYWRTRNMLIDVPTSCVNVMAGTA